MNNSKTIQFVIIILFLGSNLQSLGQEKDQVFQKANKAYQSGEYLQAREQFESLLETSGDNRGSIITNYFETYLYRGEYKDGLTRVEDLLQQNPQDPYLFGLKGRFLIATGNIKEAEQAFIKSQTIDEKLFVILLEIAEFLEKSGRGNQAFGYYRAIASEYRRNRFTEASSIGIAARAYAKLQDFHEANQIFRLAYQVDPKNSRNLNWWAELFAEKYNSADAKRTYEEALSYNPHNADLYVGLARALDGISIKSELADKALEKNPNHIGAMNIKAEIQILDVNYEEAKIILDKALQINPVDEMTLANLATIYHLNNESSKYAEIEKKVLEINPQCTNFYTILAENCVRRFRYRDVVNFCYKAIEKNQRNWQAFALAGSNLLRIGEIDNARYYLERAFKNDPFNLFARNTLELLDEYANFTSLESEHFSLLIHNSESDILGLPILKMAEESLDSLSKRYPYQSQQKIRIEAYNDHDDFAVRISGLPGISLLGVCFGDVLAMDTPKAQPDMEYNWARTLWHEIAHVMALGISNNRVPRWFTEGLSVYEEIRARPQWRRKMDVELFSALDHNLLFSLENINEGFTRPKFPEQIMVTYYQSGKFIQYLTKRYGFDSVIEILKQYGSGKDTAQAFGDVLGLKLQAVEDLLWQDIRSERAIYNEALTNLPPLFHSKDKKRSISKSLFGETKNPFFEKIKKGNELLKDKDYQQAEEVFLHAIELYPFYTQSGNPYQGLAHIYRETEKQAELQNILELFVSVTEYGAEESRELGLIYEGHGNQDRAIYYYDRSMQVEPYDLNIHVRLANLYKNSKNFEAEAQERKAILALNPLDRSSAYYDLALSYFNLGNKIKAKRQVLKSLELAPGFREAQKLLLKCVDYQNESMQ